MGKRPISCKHCTTHNPTAASRVHLHQGGTHMFDVTTSNYESHLAITNTCKQKGRAGGRARTHARTHNALSAADSHVLLVDLSQRAKGFTLYSSDVLLNPITQTLQTNQINVNIHFMLKWFILRDMERGYVPVA